MINTIVNTLKWCSFFWVYIFILTKLFYFYINGTLDQAVGRLEVLCKLTEKRETGLFDRDRP